MDRYIPIGDFEKKRFRTLCWALLAGLLHTATKWVGGGAVAWATVVLMGGFASQLAISDFRIITQVVLLIIFELTLALFTCKLVTKKSLSTGSIHPWKLRYRDLRLVIVNVVKLISVAAQCFLIIRAFFISYSTIHAQDWGTLLEYAFSSPHTEVNAPACTANLSLSPASQLQVFAECCFPPTEDSTCSATANLQACLCIFYQLVLITCVMAALCNVYTFVRVCQAFWFIVLGAPKSLSLTRYHDEVLSRGLSSGLVDANEFDWRDFMLQGVAEDLVERNIPPLEVRNQNKDFIDYFLHYPRGVEMIMGMLASENILLQQTAANMPGFWSSEPKRMEKDGMELLSRLGEKLGMPGKVAEGAANSFKALAVTWQSEVRSPLLNVYVSRSGEAGCGSVASVGSRSEEGDSSNHRNSRETISLSQGGGAEAAAAAQSAGGSDESGSAVGNGGTGGESSGALVPEGGGAGQCAAVNGGGGGGGSKDGSGDRLKWNVVRKMVDLVANKRLPTLLVYVRVLDSFFMSESVRNSLKSEERKQIRQKLLEIIRNTGVAQQSDAADRVALAVDPSPKARTRLLAFSALAYLRSEDVATSRDLLQELDGVLRAVPEKSVIWIEERDRYISLCKQYEHEPGEWLTSKRWKINSAGKFPAR